MSEERAFLSEVQKGGRWVSTFQHDSSIRELTQNLTTDEFILCMSLAATAVQNMKQSATTIKYKEALTQEIKRQTTLHDAELANLRQQSEQHDRTLKLKIETADRIHQEENLTFQTKLKELKSQLFLAETAERKVREQMESFQISADSVKESAIRTLLEQKDALHRQEIQNLKESYREFTQTFQVASEKSMEAIKTFYAEKDAKSRNDIVNSSVKGKHGEREFEELAAQYTKWPRLVNTSKTSHGTDRSCKIRSCETLFEVKNYSTDVPSSEVKKFLRDMEEHADVPFGVFISLKTDITGKKSSTFMTSEWTPKSQLLLFINSFHQHSAQDVLEVVDMCADMAQLVYRAAAEKPSESEASLKLESRIEAARQLVEAELKRITDLSTTFACDKRNLVDMINKQHLHYSTQLKQAKVTFQTILETLLGKLEELDMSEAPEAAEEPVLEENAAAPKSRGRPKGAKNKVSKENSEPKQVIAIDS